VIAGGVAANKGLRVNIKASIKDKKIMYPDLEFCTDNAAMIAYLGELKLKHKETTDIKFGIKPNLKITTF